MSTLRSAPMWAVSLPTGGNSFGAFVPVESNGRLDLHWLHRYYMIRSFGTPVLTGLGKVLRSVAARGKH